MGGCVSRKSMVPTWVDTARTNRPINSRFLFKRRGFFRKQRITGALDTRRYRNSYERAPWYALVQLYYAEREAWVRGRETTVEEDMVYSLLGMFDVHMPLIYGEGREKAQERLRRKVQKAVKGTRANDFSVSFSLSEVPETQHFVARESEIAKMRRTLDSDGSRRVVVLHGLGGIGKTQLAVAYTKRYRDEYSAVFWLNIKDEASI
ncbi:hypothetical protein BKA67DRAFT_656789 [Truncatella angustata]|uniref:NB-ARC domain-containing protein n=1 Tax=Truncatella angustata TaxID=152316 RepID=A0A9P8UUK1_9PEZI|nr:uncharacterized protein BKA67DRAFT_656789 [Truncatella angustata]KAH6658618.1 hypothetical protein BKA67DRAFT_656789 [Truncatella angustata]